jgi:hypothetical protein
LAGSLCACPLPALLLLSSADLAESDVVGILAEAAAAHIQVILADQTMGVVAHAAGGRGEKGRGEGGKEMSGLLLLAGGDGDGRQGRKERRGEGKREKGGGEERSLCAGLRSSPSSLLLAFLPVCWLVPVCSFASASVSAAPSRSPLCLSAACSPDQARESFPNLRG